MVFPLSAGGVLQRFRCPYAMELSVLMLFAFLGVVFGVLVGVLVARGCNKRGVPMCSHGWGPFNSSSRQSRFRWHNDFSCDALRL